MNGKGDKHRSISKKFFHNYDKIQWGTKCKHNWVDAKEKEYIVCSKCYKTYKTK